MARQLEVFGIKFKGEGFEQLKGIQKELKALSSSTRLSNAAFADAAKQVLAYGKRTSTTTASVKAQLTALKTLRDQVGLTSRAYKGMTGEIKALEQIQKRGFTDKQLLSQFPGAKPRTIKAQIGAALRQLEESSMTDGSYSNALLEATKRQEKFNSQLKEQALITKNLFQMDQSRDLTTTRYELPDPQQGSEGIKALGQKSWIERFLHAHISSPLWKKANQMPDPGEVSPYGGYKARKIEEKTAFKYGIPLQIALPQTTNALQFGLAKVQEELGDLTIGSDQYYRVLGQVAEAQHKYNRALSQTTRDLKNATNMRPVSRDLLTARRNLAGSRRIRSRAGTGFSEFSQDAEFGIYSDGRAIQKALARRQRDQAKRQGFTKSSNTPFEVSGLYNQISSIGMSGIGANIDRMGKSWRTVRKDILAATKASNGSISSLQSQRSAFEQLRLGLDPTSKAFRQLTKDISQVDRQLNKLNTNKFSGKNLARTGQSILGASFFGGPAGFLGSSLGAGFEALRPGGDMAQGAIAGGLVGSQVLQPIAAFGSESATYTAMIEKSKIALEAATKIEGDAIASKEAYTIALRTAAGVTERFNVPQELAARGMTRLSAAVIGAGGNIHNAGIAFENISAAIKATGGSTEDTKAAVTAMVQIFSKGKVSAEELSGQLGERFPAAVTLFAEANNMTTQELQKGLKDGVIGLDKLWKFVLKLGDKYVDVAEKIGSASVEAGVRSQIAWNKVKLAVGKALQPIGADLQVIGAEILTNLVPVLELAAKVLGAIGRAVSFTAKAVVENFDKIVVVLGTFGSTLIWVNRVALTQFIQTLSVKLGNALSGVIAKMGLAKIATLGFSGSIKAAKAAVVAFTASLMANPIIAVATGLSIAATAAWHFGRRWQRTVKEIESGKMTISDAKIKVAELKKALEGETNEEVAARLETQIAMYEAAIKARKEIIKKANLDEADSFEGKDGKDGIGKWQIIRDHVDELGKQGEHLQGVFVNAFQSMEDAMVNFITTGKLNFKEFARSIIADLARMIAKQMLFNALSGFINRITKPAAPFTKGIGPTADGAAYGQHLWGNKINDIMTNTTAPVIKQIADPYEGISTMAKGGAFAKNGIVPYSKGGVIRRPTLSLMGEQGAEAILPLQRGRGGRLGVAMQGGGGVTTVNYTGPTLNFNGDEYVPKSAVGQIINSAASKGAAAGQSQTIASLRNSRSTRSRLGM